jgi:hypothetical protein
VGLDVEVVEAPPQLRAADPDVVGQGVGQLLVGPRRHRVVGVLGRGGQGGDLHPLVVAVLARGAGAWGIAQTVEAIGQEPLAPHGHVGLVHPHRLGDLARGHSLGGQQDDPDPFHVPWGVVVAHTRRSNSARVVSSNVIGAATYGISAPSCE